MCSEKFNFLWFFLIPLFLEHETYPFVLNLNTKRRKKRINVLLIQKV